MSFLETFLKNATAPEELAVVSLDVLRSEIKRRNLPGDTSTVDACVSLIVTDNNNVTKSSPNNVSTVDVSGSAVKSSKKDSIVSSNNDVTNVSNSNDNDDTSRGSAEDSSQLRNNNVSKTATVDNSQNLSDYDVLFTSKEDRELLDDDGNVLLESNEYDLSPAPNNISLASDEDEAEHLPASKSHSSAPSATDNSTAPVVVPYYDGEPTTSITSFVDSLERWARQSGADDFRKYDYAMSRLTGMAADWQQYAGRRHSSWQPWKEALLRRFRLVLSLDEWYARAKARRQGSQESLQHYAGQMLVLFLDPPDGEEEPKFDKKLDFILDGLYSERDRKTLRSKKIEDEDELMALLLGMDNAGLTKKNTASKSKSSKQASSRESNNSSKRRPSLSGQSNDSDAEDTPGASDKSIRRCYICDSKSHLSFECPVTCPICDKVGHTAKRCLQRFSGAGSSSGSSAKKGTRMCYSCGSDLHISTGCPVPCSTCKKVGHSTRRCPLDSDLHSGRSARPRSSLGRNSDLPSRLLCQRCGSRDHYEMDCMMPCPFCRRSGHSAKHCPYSPSSGRYSPTIYDCVRCGSTRHPSALCPQPCSLCFVAGHTVLDCPLFSNSSSRRGRDFSPPSSSMRQRRSGSVSCQGCGSDKHLVENCPSRPKSQRSCHACHSSDHLIAACPIWCSTCRKMGHPTKECSDTNSRRSEDRPKRQTTSNSRICHGCGSDNHLQENCPKSKKSCHACKSNYHLIADCPFWCSDCREMGHSTMECRSGMNRGGGGDWSRRQPKTDGRCCRECGSDKHLYDNCPCRPKAKRSCHACHADDHLIAACPNWCSVCRKSGHPTKECPKSNNLDSEGWVQSRDDESQIDGACFRCGSNSHKTVDCERPCPVCNERGHRVDRCPVTLLAKTGTKRTADSDDDDDSMSKRGRRHSQSDD